MERLVADVVCHSAQLFLKSERDLPRRSASVRFIHAIICYAVNKEKAQHLNSFWLQLQLAIEMFPHGVANLRTPHIVPQAADFFTDTHDATICETDELRGRFSVDFSNPETLIRGALVRASKQIVPLANKDRLCL